MGLRTLDVVEVQGAGSDWKGLSAYILAKERARERRLNPLKDLKCLPHCLKNLTTCWLTLKHSPSGDSAGKIISQRSVI